MVRGPSHVAQLFQSQPCWEWRSVQAEEEEEEEDEQQTFLFIVTDIKLIARQSFVKV
jgi:NACalpha-BTF3-like transcription factor